MIDLLDKLHDIELPSPIGLWPFAPGWYFVAILVLIFGFFASLYLRRFWRRARIKRQALLVCDGLESRYTLTQENICGELSVLLRRITLAFHPHTNATLLEEEWIDFLNNAKHNRLFSDGFFTDELAALLRSSPYQKHAPEQTLQLLQACREWIKRQG